MGGILLSLKEINVKRVYDVTHKQAADEFFNPALANAFLYQRATAYFSSASFRILALGLSSLFWSNGKMQLLAGRLLSKEDWYAIASSKGNVNIELTKIFPTIEELKKMMEDDNVRALAELLRTGSLEVKFVLSVNPERLFHSKFGIILDKEGCGIAFAGSINETEEGLESNIEAFNTFRSWEEGEKEYYDEYSSLFRKYWEGMAIDGIMVSDIPEELKDRVIIAATEFSKEQKNILGSHPCLRPYQREAVNYWKRNGYKGLLEMATGTGKTITALECVKELNNSQGNYPTIIAVPTIEVARQWQASWMTFFGKYPMIYTSEGSKKAGLKEYVSIIGNGAAIIVTYSFLAGKFFRENILPLLGKDALLIADEAHHLGAPKYKEILSWPYRFRLGLSATPHRLFDDEGNELIEDFFGKETFAYGLQQAIDDGYLVRYLYFPKFVELTDEEINDYLELTRRMLRHWAKYLDDLDKERKANKDYLERLIYERAKIVKKASAKYAELRGILAALKREGKLSKLIIFCEDNEQLKLVSAELRSLGVVYRKISSDENSAQREKAINEFASGDIDAIVSMRVLDEGVDIQTAERAILMSSSKNPRQYIQRAGRVLRKSPGKKMAEIFDIIVYADPVKVGSQIEKIERVAIKGEIMRAMYFTQWAQNNLDCYKAIKSLKNKINI